MKMKAIHYYVAFICLLAGTTASFLQWSSLTALTSSDLLGLGSLLVLALLSESVALTVTIARNAGTSSITFIPVLASLALFGPPATVVLLVSVGLVVEPLLRRKDPVRVLFNLAQWTLGISLGGALYTALDGYPLALEGMASGPSIVGQLIPFAAFTFVFLGLNHVAVSLAIAIDQGLSFERVWENRAGRAAGNILYDLLISPIALAVAFLFLELGFIGIVVALLPLLFIRRAYLATFELQEANRNLLKALVKAIETRDPYTSGHSLRVSQLARRIAGEMGVSRRKAEKIETAALLHDIGKIESIYTEIIQKPGSLTDEEREIIQSHVTKGVELLKSLSSFDAPVLDAVKHHHERVDGKGYPDGLKGEEVPVGARIIKVCDAIDAMLSDRPYRDALTLPAVREQLVSYQGTQFDQEVVRLVVNSNILEEHRAKIALESDQSEQDVESLDTYVLEPFVR